MNGESARREAAIAARRALTQTTKSAGVTYKTFSGTTKALDEATGEIEALVNSLAVEDLQHDVVEVGAWNDVLADTRAGRKSWPSIVFGHDWSVPVGRVTYAAEQGKSLYIKGQFNLRSSRGRDAFEDVRFGSIKEWSVGFLTTKDGEHFDQRGVRHVTRVAEWPEVSCVLKGASPGTTTLSVKNAASVRREDPSLPLADLIAGIIEEELTNKSFRDAESQTPAADWSNEQRYAWLADQDFENPRRVDFDFQDPRRVYPSSEWVEAGETDTNCNN
jgi:HK97 family phage prohead protease